MDDNEDIPIEFQCNLIRIIDVELKKNRVNLPKRRKIVEGVCFAISEMIESGSVEVDGAHFDVELLLKKGRKNYGKDFPYHEYSFGNVAWYYEEGGEKMYAQAERRRFDQVLSVAKVDASFPTDGYRRAGKNCHEWSTASGYIFSGWFGGDYSREGTMYLWAEFLVNASVEIRIDSGDGWGDWLLMESTRDDPRKRVLAKDVSYGPLGIQYRVDGEVLLPVKITVRYRSNKE